MGSVLRSYSASNTLARSMESFICVCTCIEYPLLNATWDDECTTWLKQAISDERSDEGIKLCVEIPGTGEPDLIPA